MPTAIPKRIRQVTLPTTALRIFVALAATLFAATLLPAQQQPAQKTQIPFPDTDSLISRVAQHQKEVESLLDQYTFTDKTMSYTLDEKGQVRGQHADTFYITPTPYEIFVLHISHDQKALSESDLQKQENEIEHKIHEDEKKAEKSGELHPRNTLLFADIILKSRFTPLRWDDAAGKPTIVYAFEPKAPAQRQGDLMARVAGDMKGKMWINTDDAEVVRMEFTSASSLSLGYGILGNVKHFEGYIEQQKVHGEIWLPSHQEFVADGRQLIKGFRIRQVDEFSDYLKASTDVFQQIHAPKAATSDASSVTQKNK
ncbi:MAG: hypothetical protein ABSC10_02990 [Candidatus Acidiferrales bacterium]|jgi:hypothetical protein